jgi:hypothetical protein
MKTSVKKVAKPAAKKAAAKGSATAPGKKKTGRHSMYSPKLADRICGLLIEGRSLSTICKAAGMPAFGTVMRWLAEETEEAARFRAKYARAREAYADACFEGIQEIADRVPPDRDEIAKARLRIDTEKWRLGRMAPKKYGDKLDVTSGDQRLTGVLLLPTAPASREEWERATLANQEALEEDGGA